MKIAQRILMIACCGILLSACGCVERELTIKTVPENAYVELNDEQVGLSPVTVSFNWYGTYRVRLEKEGYQTLVVNKELDRPAADYFPLDLFRDIFTPDTVDSYEWTFELDKYIPADRNELIERAQETEKETEQAIDQVWTKIEKDE